jgi:spore maturation protein CgeB
MKIVYFTHSLISCWNHGNAHFLRGVMRALLQLGHDVTVYEPAGSWSRENLLADCPAAIDHFNHYFPELAQRTTIMMTAPEHLAAAVDGADLVIVHEWNEPGLVAELGRLRRQTSRFRLLFHDTHHRMVSAPEQFERYDLSSYDAILAFGETLSRAYRDAGHRRVMTWHEAADTWLFRPVSAPAEREGAVWIGNWGDGERAQELQDYLLSPMQTTGVSLDIYGVRYPAAVRNQLAARGLRYHGWLANARVPAIFARHSLTLHVPRRFYVSRLPGIPTIRVFEALACGIPLLSSPWEDTENLFAPGRDFLMARSPSEMTSLLRDLMNDARLRADLAAHGLATIRARHTCQHRAEELMQFTTDLGVPAAS